MNNEFDFVSELRLKLKKRALEILLWRQEVVQLRARNNLIEKQLCDGKSELALLEKNRSLRAENMELRSESRKLQAYVTSLLNSTSWKLTRPLRRLSRLFKGKKVDLELSFEPSSLMASQVASQDEPASFASLSSVKIADSTSFELPISRCIHDLFRGRRIFMFSGVPYDDIGGGQRAAQLTRVMLERGEQVVFLHAYQKWEDGRKVRSDVRKTGLLHMFLEDVNVEHVMSLCTPDDMAIFEFPHPAFLPYFEYMGSLGCHRVFELIDAWDSSLGGDWFDVGVMQKYIDESEMVVGSARVLQQQLIGYGRHDALYLPNAANDAVFDRYRQYARPCEYIAGKRVFIYFGSLYGDWFDWDSLNHAARRCAKDSVFYLIGDPPTGIQIEANVRLLGPRQIDQLPGYLAHCDAALIPFKPGHICDAVSPIKVFEYIAMGVPVIANRLPEIECYPNVKIAASADEFSALCAEAQCADRRLSDIFLIDNSWAARVDVLLRTKVPEKCISLIILIHNNEGIIARCLRSMQLHGRDYLKEIIVVDNASTDGGAELIRREFPDVIVLENPANGCSSGRNLGVSHSRGRFIAFFDSDQWLTGRGCFEEALMILVGNPDIGAVGWSAGWFDCNAETLGGPIVDYLPSRGTDTDEYQVFGYRSDIAYVATGGLFLLRSTFDAIGGFDVAYDPTCFEDTDLAFSILDKGWRLAYRNLQGIHHQPHQTTKADGNSESYKKLFERNSDYFSNKWRHRQEFIFNLPN